MDCKNKSEHIFNSRKKAIYSDRKVPQPGPKKLVWAINMQGSTLMPIDQDDTFVGDYQVKINLCNKMMPQLNKSIGKIWLEEQQNTYKSKIFPKINELIKLLLIILGVLTTIVLLLSQFQSDIFVQILLSSVMIIWLISLIIAIYANCQPFVSLNYDAMIVSEIKSIIAQFNELYLKERGYIAKCDQWGIWVCVTQNANSIFKIQNCDSQMESSCT